MTEFKLPFYLELPENPPTIGSVKRFSPAGSWSTKSGGRLDVLFALPIEVLQQTFFNYDPHELARLPSDIRADIQGLREYTVENLAKGSVGGEEYHRIRWEIVTSYGKTLWYLEDIYGNKQTLTVSSRQSLLIPPFILHIYQSLEEQGKLSILANTLFNPQDPRTHDTFSSDHFKMLQYKNKGCQI